MRMDAPVSPQHMDVGSGLSHGEARTTIDFAQLVNDGFGAVSLSLTWFRYPQLAFTTFDLD
jgi:hypothetical protein